MHLSTKSTNGFFVIALFCLFGSLSFLGCSRDFRLFTPPEETVDFEPNYVYAEVATRQFDVDVKRNAQEAYRLTIDWFGTPDEPKLPALMTDEDSDYVDLISLDNLRMSAGPVTEEDENGNSGLFRLHCISCHGITGQGRGPVASSQNPYPRDFRRGVFKYKTTPRNSKPLKEDLIATLHRGLDGSQMPRFNELSPEQRLSLAEYTMYLSIRGEFERALVTFAALDLDPEDDAPENRTYTPSDKSVLQDQLDIAEEELDLILSDWYEAEDNFEEVEITEDFPVIGYTPSEEIDRDELLASIKTGEKLFNGAVAVCSKCHGVGGKGSGDQLPGYDDWTREFTSLIRVDPKNEDEFLPMLTLGALRPQLLLPRNLTTGKFRGGGSPDDIYRRIKYGIAGSTMPAAAIVRSSDQVGLTENDVWHIVNYVLSLSTLEIN